MTRLPPTLLMRFAALAATALAVRLLPERDAWLSFVYILSIGHYALAAYYSRGQTARVLSTPTGAWAFTALVLVGLVLYRSEFSLLVFFGVHHVLNEAYLWERNPSPEKAAAINPLRAATVLLHSFIYIWLLRWQSPLASVDRRLLAAGLFVSACLFLLALRRAAPALTPSERLERSAFEFAGLGLCAVSHYHQVMLLHIVAYHFLFWTLYPVPGIRSRGPAALRDYIVWTAAITALVFLASPFGLRSYPIAGSLFQNSFLFFSYLHITVSFALSDANPLWLRRAFKPAVA